MSDIVNLPATAPARPALVAGNRPMAIVPQSMEECYRLAKAVCAAKMAPRGLDTPEQAMVAIMHGLEIGLTPMTALQRICVVNGRPTIWGDGAMSLVRASGLCEGVKEWIDGVGDARVAVCEAKRKGEQVIRRTFSVADAKTSGLWTKRGRDGQPTPWQQYPERMLQMRARAFALRDGFADVLGGLYLREEIEDDRQQAARRNTAVEAPPEPDLPETTEGMVPEASVETAHDVVGVAAKSAHASDTRTETAPAASDPAGATHPLDIPPALDRRGMPPSTDDPERWLKWLDKKAATFVAYDALEAWWNDKIAPQVDKLFPPDQEEAIGIFRSHEQRLAP